MSSYFRFVKPPVYDHRLGTLYIYLTHLKSGNPRPEITVRKKSASSPESVFLKTQLRFSPYEQKTWGINVGEIVEPTEFHIAMNYGDTYGWFTVYPFVCDDGTKRSPKTCYGGQVIHEEVCEGNAWKKSGEECPFVCDDGTKRSPKTCWDGAMIHSEVCHDDRWVPSGEVCSRPICSFENIAHKIEYIQWRGQHILNVIVTAVNTSSDPNPVCNIELKDDATGKVLATTGVVIFGGGSSRVKLQIIPVPTRVLNYTLYGRIRAVHYGGPYDFKLSSSFTAEEARKHAEMIAEAKRRAEEAARIAAEEEARRIAAEEEARRIAGEVVYLPKPECTEGDKKPGYICSEGKWVPYTPPDTSAADARIAAEEEAARIAAEVEARRIAGEEASQAAAEEEARRIAGEVVYLPKPECTEGDKKPGYTCSGGKWVPYTPEQETGRLYVKFAIPWLDMLPGIPYESWMIIPPGFKITEEP